MICLACRRLYPGLLCAGCQAGLRPAPDRLLVGDLRVRSAYLHTGPARALVHSFKYRGIGEAGRILAEAMAPLLPAGVILVPLGRARLRQLGYGIDPARELCRHLALRGGLEVADLLVPPWISPGRARVSRKRRRPPMFSVRRLPECPVVLIDDVVTTGGTIEHARRLMGRSVVLAITATSSWR
jgi:predicted amidophosphoribosyltransferase